MADRLREITLETQRDIFRLGERDHGLTRKVVSSKSGIQYDALGTYWRGEHVMPITEVIKLCDVIPDYLLSRLFNPVHRQLTVEEGEDGDLDELGQEAANFTADYVSAKCGDGKITQIEHARLKAKASRLGDTAQRVSAG
jgi:hypothetical protein